MKIKIPNNFETFPSDLQEYIIALAMIEGKIVSTFNYKIPIYKPIIPNYYNNILDKLGINREDIPSIFCPVDIKDSINSSLNINNFGFKICFNRLDSRYSVMPLNKQLINKNTDSSIFKTIADKSVMLNLAYANFLNKNDDIDRKHELNNLDLEVTKINRNFYCINPNLARLAGLRQISTQELLSLLNIDIDQIEKYLTILKKKQFNLIIVGLGGSMSNFLYWLEEFCKICNIDEVINKIAIYENDKLEFTNLFRIPLDYTSYLIGNDNYEINPLSKINLSYRINHCCRNILHIHDYFDINDELHKERFNWITKDCNHICLIGALDLKSRFKDYPFNVILPLHKDNEVITITNPNPKDIDLGQESYGKLELSYFYLNMIKMTFSVLKELSLNFSEYKHTNPNKINKTILEYDSSKEDLQPITCNYNLI